VAQSIVVTGREQLVMFRLGEQRYAIPLVVTERVVRAAEVTPLPNAPSIVLGAINIAGSVLPVLDMRRRLCLAGGGYGPSDQFLIARAGQRIVVLVVDETQGVIECPASEVVESAAIAPGLEHIRGVIRRGDGLILIHDLERFLSLDEAHAVDEALRQEVPHAYE